MKFTLCFCIIEQKSVSLQKVFYKMTTSLLAFDEIADFISELNPAKIIALKPSEVVQERLDNLLAKNREDKLTDEEKHELERYLTLEHLIALAKIRARKRLNAMA
jgi:SpoU rRNA methylase family enzyme